MAKKKPRWSFGPETPRRVVPSVVATRPSGIVGPTAGASVHAPVVPAHPEHRGGAVRVGPHTVYAGGTRDLRDGDLTGYDLVIPLTDGTLPLLRRQRAVVWSYKLMDYGGVPADWAEFMQEVIAELREGRRIIAFCMGSHGRTGTFLASLIALCEGREETPDPLAATRARHCYKAVETRAQAQAVFALRGEVLPAQYEQEFRPRTPLATAGSIGAIGIPTSERWWERK